MKIDTLALSNFRGFRQLDIQFCEDVTVIAGVNGIGKSGILKALRHLLSHFQENVYGADDALPIESADVHLGEKSMTFGIYGTARGEKFDVRLGQTLIPDEEFPKIRKEIEDLRQQQRYVNKKSDEAIGIEVRIEFLEDRLEGHDKTDLIIAPGFQKDELVDKPLPVFAYYSVNRAFTDLPKRLLKAKPLTQGSAHENSMTGGRVNLNDFANWFRVTMEGELGDSTQTDNLARSLKETISVILPDFKELKLEQPEGKLPFFSIAKEGTRFSLAQLSDGERALLSLALDLTKRLSLANPDSKHPSKDGYGIVLIDEIELHLHPKWQRLVVSRLRQAFPNCQFIVTTHSPLVLGEVQAGKIRFIEADEDTGKVEVFTPQEAYGLDANRVLDELMDAPERSRKVQEKLNKLFTLIDDEAFDQAREEMKPLIKLLGENEPELTRASTLIKFLEGEE